MPSSAAGQTAPRSLIAGLLVSGLGLLALLAPFVTRNHTAFALGVLLLCSALPETAIAFFVPHSRGGLSAFFASFLTLLAGILLVAAPQLAIGALALLLGGSFFLSGAVKLTGWAKGRRQRGQESLLIDGLLNIALGLFLAAQWPVPGVLSVGIAVGLHLLASGWSMIFGQTDEATLAAEAAGQMHPDRRLGLPPHPHFDELRKAALAKEDERRRIDDYWVATFLITFLAIHVGRMDLQGNPIGLVSPVVAVFGDALLALLIAWTIVIPLRVFARTGSRRFERHLWQRRLERIDAGTKPRFVARALDRWLLGRYRFGLILQQCRHSPTAAIRQGLHWGLPFAALFIALNPVWGFSWYFNSENWVTGVWERWTEYRVNDWRQYMVKATRAQNPDVAEADFSRIAPAGTTTDADFSFLVIGDTGEGDASQHILRDQLILLGQRPEVKFLVLSSDVIYPAGAMKDYEFKFYLPFKGFNKPIVAIPGNHDWYDALEAFTANFFEPNAARAALRARREADHGLTSTTEKRIEQWIESAARLRREYGVVNGLQRAPYFEVQTERFALITVDTGILREVDDDQFKWLEGALERSSGKFKMVVSGHPLYAGGRYLATVDDSFAKLHRLMREHEVEIVMGGDTHYLEYYKEPYERSGAARVMNHFVNGGGGAYLSIGTPLNWPKTPTLADTAFYPRKEAIVDKLAEQTPLWKMPMWFWVEHLAAWPTSEETMASAFDFNQAPFFQSFVEVRVEPSTQSVRIWPYGIHGRLRWGDFQTHGQVMPPDAKASDPVEFRVPLPRRP